MTDELLLAHLRIGWHDDDTPIWVSDAMTEAAARIEQLKAKNMRLSGMCYDLYADIQASNELGKALEEDAGQLRAERDKYESAWMTAEGKLADAESDIAHLHKLLAEAASDLTAYVDAEYPPDTCAQYPDIARRHYRDMELVRRIEAELKGESHE